MIRNLAWLRTEASRLLNHNSGQPDQAFAGVTNDTNEDIDSFIQQAYDIELEEANIGTDYERLMLSDETLTWAADVATLTLPAYLAESDILHIEDITNYATGSTLWVSGKTEHYTPEIFFQNRTPLRWGEDGPGAATTLRITYLPQAEHLKEPDAEPSHIPSQYRWLLVWTAAILGRQAADEGAPGQWLAAQQEWRQRFHMALAKGRPRMTNKARMMPVGDTYSCS